MTYEVITTTLVAAVAASSQAGPYDLTDLGTVYSELDLPASNTKDRQFLQRAISNISLFIQDYCNRTFQVETLLDDFFPQRDAYPYQVPATLFPLQASRWPILPTLISQATTADAPSGTVLTVGSVTGIQVGMPVHAPPAIYGGPNIPGIAFDATVASVNTETNQVTMSLPLTQDLPESTVVNFGPRICIQDPAGDWTDLWLGTDFKIDAARGWWIRLNQYTGYATSWSPVETVIRYQAGFNPLPYNLVGACLDLVTSRYKQRGQNPYLKSREQPALGTETFWVGGLPGVKGLPEEIAMVLDNFRVPVTA